MKFHEQLKAYRDEQLAISQEEAAKLLKISNATLSLRDDNFNSLSISLVR